MDAKPDIQIDVHAVPADLTVVVKAAPANDGRQFWCTVRTRLLPKYSQGITAEWNLNAATRDIVNNFMSEFTKERASNAERRAALVGAGRQLFKIAPPHFEEVFWALIDSGVPLKTISIVSQEPYIPWELMIPRRRVNDRMDTHPALGVEFVVGRWTQRSLTAGRQLIPLEDSYVIAPKISKRPLTHAPTESLFVRQNFPGQEIDPVNFENIQTTLLAGGKTLIHFACHGISKEGGTQEIYLDNDLTLSSNTILGMDGVEHAIHDKRPLVFLNACEVGRTIPSLTGVGGFADSFLELGASAVIAPLWSVKDNIAHQIALEFYGRVLKEPATPFAEILRDIRAKAYDPTNAEDSYAAYCFYGDPLVSRLVS